MYWTAMICLFFIAVKYLLYLVVAGESRSQSHEDESLEPIPLVGRLYLLLTVRSEKPKDTPY